MKRILTKDFLSENKEICLKLYNNLNQLLQKEDCDKLINQIENIRTKYLYPTKFHGLYHSQKVLLFAYLIGKHEGLSEEDMQIVMDAAVYHDIGRQNEVEDEFHGYSSSRKINDESRYLLTSDIYSNKDNVYYLRAICDAHSSNDKNLKRIFEDYQFENPNLVYERFEKLAKILKDADALDRTRFRKTSSAVLEEKYLRFDFSKSLIDLATDINVYYVLKEIEEIYPKFKQKYGYQQNEQEEKACLHGIGTDFFKLESILENGILSAYALMKEDIQIPRNFYGSNKELWISVVDADMISVNGDAYKKYIKDNISLFCFVPRLKYKEDYIGSQADVHNKKEYNDEKYAFERINIEKIHSIIIPNSIKNKKIIELSYLNCASKYDIIIEIIRYYKKMMNKNGFYNLDESKIYVLLEEFYNNMFNYEMLDEQQQKTNLNAYLKSLDLMKEKLNEEIQIWFNDYYEYLLEIENPTVIDVVKYIVDKNNNIEAEIIDEPELNETLITIKPVVKKNVLALKLDKC